MSKIELTYEIALNTLDNLTAQISLDRKGHMEVQQCILKLKELVDTQGNSKEYTSNDLSA